MKMIQKIGKKMKAIQKNERKRPRRSKENENDPEDLKKMTQKI